MKSYFLIFISVFITHSTFSQTYKKQVENNNRFTFELFSDLNTAKNNLFLSPFSVSDALAMTYDGARNKTRAEMADILHFPDDAKTVNESFKNLISDIQKSTNPKFYFLTIANSIWAQKDYDFLHSFFSNIIDFYDAKIEAVNFKTGKERELARKKINNWTAEKTNNKIKNLLEQNSLDRDTKMVLVNTIYFLAKWDKTFNKKLTKPDTFYGFLQPAKKDFMHTKKRLNYAKIGNIKFLEIPYKNKRASMIILMPDTSINLKEFSEKLNPDFLNNFSEKAEYQNVNLALPKFKIEYKTDLAKTLYNAGMHRAFTNRADFSGMTCKKELRIDKVIHQTFINVDESGTEAAAATAVVMKRITSVNPADIFDFKADHPFVFLIRDNLSGSILFIGQLIK